MRESYDFNVSIRTLKKELPETSQISIGDDACLFNIKYNGIDDKFSKPIRLVGNVMVFCVKGSVHMSVNLNEYDVKEGCLVVLTDQDIVKVEKGSDDDIRDLHWVVIAMSQNFLTNFRVDFRKILSEGVALIETPVLHLDQNIRGYFEDYLKLIGKLANSELPMYKDAVRSLISSMVSIAAGQWIADINRLRDEKVVKLNSRSEHKTLTFRQFIKLVSENYTQQRQVIFYADQLCMSPKYLSKLVKDVSGKSAPEWIDSYVLLEAKHLLKYSDMPIKEIVFRLNFSNQTVFYKYFKAHTGMTPTDYRNS
jgi:AraC-like DNA-binding protein